MINYHFHDEFSADASGPLGDHCAAAVKQGFTHLCVTNHAETMDTSGAWRANPDEMLRRFRQSAAAVAEARDRYPDLEIGLGVELEYRRGWRPVFEHLLESLPFDFVLGSVHVVDGHNISGGADLDAFFLDRTQKEAYEAYFEELAEMVDWGAFDVVAHFDLIKRYGHRHYGPYVPDRYRAIIEPILADMARRGMGLEINTSGVRQAPGVPYPEPDILEWALDVGVEILTIGTDSHAPGQFGAGREAGLELARDTGWTGFTLFEGRRPAGRLPLGV